MGRKMLVAVACWLTLSTLSTLGRARADTSAISAMSAVEDSVAEASVPRLYRSIPVGVYASASPYASFSFHVPTFVAPKVVHGGLIKQESVIVENKEGFLKDSYGNKFVDSPQALPYRTAFPQQYVQLQELPAHLAQPLVAAAPNFDYKQLSPQFFGPPKFKLQAVSPSTSNHYAINQPYEYGPIRVLSPAQQQRPTNNVEKSQRLEDNSNRYNQRDRGVVAVSETNNKEKNAPIKLETKSSVPLLDLSLLEPLTFENPLVPQVQHFLPRISSVKYHKLPQLNVDEIKSKVKEVMIQRTKSFDNGDLESKSKLKSSRQQQQKPHSEDDEKRDEQEPPRDLPNVDSYEINSPNYRESFNEKVVNYNKETESDPVHYSYEMKIEKEPLSYNYVRTTNEPYREQPNNENKNTKHDDDQNPKHLIYQFAPEESDDSDERPQRHESENSEEFSENKPARLVKHSQEKNNYESEKHRHGRPSKEALNKSEKIVHKKEEHDRKPKHQNIHHSSPQVQSQIETLSVDNPDEHKQLRLQEHEEDILVHPTPDKYASIKVDPNQHVKPKNHESREHEENPHESPRSHHREQYHPEQLVEEKAERIIITEETPQEDRRGSKEANDEPARHEGKSDEEFENGYKHGAYSYPTYEPKDTEKEIYNPEPYVPAKYQSDFDSENSPFERYVAESDEYPKSTRSNYKDARDKTKDKYYQDYAISKPESMLARFQQKEDYYKTYLHRKPEYMKDDEEFDKKKSAKYSAAPSIEYSASAHKPKHYFAKYKAAPAPQSYGYDYAKEAPKDNSAYAAGPYQRLKTHTQFVEPQFQYGFEPSVLPRLLDSELAAMASNIRSKNEKPLMRKKVYKENWYIKKTSTKGRKDTS